MPTHHHYHIITYIIPFLLPFLTSPCLSVFYNPETASLGSSSTSSSHSSISFPDVVLHEQKKYTLTIVPAYNRPFFHNNKKNNTVPHTNNLSVTLVVFLLANILIPTAYLILSIYHPKQYPSSPKIRVIVTQTPTPATSIRLSTPT